jgi:Coatomer epsilon subunit
MKGVWRMSNPTLTGPRRSVVLLTQIRLIQNRTDLARKEVESAKRWAQDSLLINLAEAWLGLRVVCSLFPLTVLIVFKKKEEKNNIHPPHHPKTTREKKNKS